MSITASKENITQGLKIEPLSIEQIQANIEAILSGARVYYIPQSMKDVEAWALRRDKIPYRVNGECAKSNDPITWISYNEAMSAYRAGREYYNGLSFALASPFAFIDIDHCIDVSGKISETAKDILNTVGSGSYCELSQSNTGLHLITCGEIPRGSNNQMGFNNRDKGVEMYSGGRFCAMTGRAIIPREPLENQSGLDKVFSRYVTKSYFQTSTPVVSVPCSLSDIDIVRRACSRSAAFSALYYGDNSKYNSSSEADFALAAMLAFWCDRDMSAMDRIFRSSGLFRDKWMREDYRTQTLSRACGACQETRSEYIRRMRQEEVSGYARQARTFI